MSDPYQSAPDNPFQPPSPATAPPAAPLDTPVTGYETVGYGAPTYSGSGDTGGAKDTAKQAAGQAASAAGDVASDAKEKASDVASTASENASAVAQTAQAKGKEVVGEAKTQAQSLLHQVREQVSQQTQQGHQSAQQGLQSIVDELSAMLDGRGSQGGPAGQLTEQARDRVNEVATWLGQRQPGDLVNEVRDFARRRPGTFLVGALVAGVAAGRLTRGAVSAHSDDSSSSTEVLPADTYSSGLGNGTVSGYSSSYGQNGLYGASDDTVITSGYPSGSTTGYGGSGYPAGAAFDQQSVDLPTGGAIDSLLGSEEPTVGYSAPPSGEVYR